MSHLLNDFLNIFQILSKFQRKIFKYLQRKAQKWRNVYPSVITISRQIGCSESTVKRATAYFHEQGWISKCKKNYQSNLYYMNDELIDLDLDNQNIFLRIKRPVNDLRVDPNNDPVLRVLKEEENIGTREEVHADREKKKKLASDRDIPYCLNIKALTLPQQQRLANNFSEHSLVSAIIEAKKYVGWGNQIRSMIALLWNLAKKHS